MLNPFPIQFLALFAYFLLRVIVGGALIFLGLQHYRHRHELKNVLVLSWWRHGALTSLIFAIGEVLIGGLLIAGAFTQIAALALMIVSSKMLIMRNWFDHPTIPTKLTYLLFFAIGLTLFITGAGALAFDLPL